VLLEEASRIHLVGDTCTHGLVCDADALSVVGGLDAAIGEDLLHHLVFVAGAKLVLKLAFAGGVEDSLLAVLRNHDLPASDNLGHGNGAVGLPLLEKLLALYEDAKLIAVAALVEDLSLG
jgi:hypothetical protein